jgi:hypothetical protein
MKEKRRNYLRGSPAAAYRLLCGSLLRRPAGATA